MFGKTESDDGQSHTVAQRVTDQAHFQVGITQLEAKGNDP